MASSLSPRRAALARAEAEDARARRAAWQRATRRWDCGCHVERDTGGLVQCPGHAEGRLK